MPTDKQVPPGSRVAVIGAGVAGIMAASTLKQAGVEVDLYEKEERAGGHLNRWHHLFPGREEASLVREGYLQQLREHSLSLMLSAEVKAIVREPEGPAGGRFRVTTAAGDSRDYGAVLLATGFRLFDAALKEEYGYGIYPRVLTSPELEQRLSPRGAGLDTETGPPKRVAFVHCVGSRDAKVGNRYCSRVCCITGVKQAMAVRERYPGCEVINFYMDLRMFGSGYEELYQEAQEVHGVNFIRGRVSEAAKTLGGAIQVKAEDTLLGRPLKVTVDWLVLLVGMEPSLSAELLASLALESDQAGFVASRDKFLQPGQSSADGVFLAGACGGPASLPESVNQARAAALSVITYLNRKG